MKLILEKWKVYVKECDANDEKLEEEDVIEEISSVAGMTGYAGSPISDKKTVDEFNESEKEISKLKGERLTEMFSTSTQMGGVPQSKVSAEKERAGWEERWNHQKRAQERRLNKGCGLVAEDDDDTQPTQGETDDSECEGEWVKWKLEDFADNPRNASRVFSVLEDIESNIGLEKLKNAVIADLSARSRVNVMSTKFGYDPNLLERMKNNDEEAVRKYYQFVINEFLFWIAYNPMSSAMQYAMRCTMLSKPTRNLAYGLISNYVLNPNKYNPKAKGKGMSAQADFYKLDKDLEPALYELPEE